MNTIGVLGIINLFFAIVIGLYFWNLLRAQQGSKSAVDRESRREMDRLLELRAISLTQPLAELTRPSCLSEVVGQTDAIKALRAAICGPNPQHVILYGPPGVGKTAAARAVLEEAKKNPLSPFKQDAKFIEIDANTARFDDRGIADPLIGSVHDPIYQGAGAMGMAGIPQPKPGAVTKAHGGVLFIDEIGELHSIQMNKLLKVLEDRKVFLESAYYSMDDTNIPQHIHDIFQNGLPADFRLIGATTRSAHDIPPAIRSRCLEIYFRSLTSDEIGIISRNAIKKIQFKAEEGVVGIVERYAQNGRDAVNMIQMAAGVALTESRDTIMCSDIEWVVESNHLTMRPDMKVPDKPQVGVVNGLAVCGPNMGLVIEVEVQAQPSAKGMGTFNVTGVVEQEEVGDGTKIIRRKSMALGSADTVFTALRGCFGIEPKDYNIHINFPGGVPIDGPSAGVAMLVGIYSAAQGIPVDNTVAMTGEVSIRGKVKPVGGVQAKIEAARRAGAKKVIIPSENWQDRFGMIEGIKILPVCEAQEAVAIAMTSSDLSLVRDKRTGIRGEVVAAAGAS